MTRYLPTPTEADSRRTNHVGKHGLTKRQRKELARKQRFSQSDKRPYTPPKLDEDGIEYPTYNPFPTGLDLLFTIHAWGRPHGSKTEEWFMKTFLDPIPGMQQDGMGNRYIRIGESDTLWSCHVDTTDSKGRHKKMVITTSGVLRLADGYKKPGSCLGADDGAGVWLLMEMIRREKPGLYIFHRGEEKGCIGSKWIARENKDLLKGITKAIAFDRRGTRDIITFQSGYRTASDEFANSLAKQLNADTGDDRLFFSKDPTGAFTDTNSYKDIIPECTNVSVGYLGNHGQNETLDTVHLQRLLRMVLKLDTSKLVVARDPTKSESKWKSEGGAYGGYYGGGYHAGYNAGYKRTYDKAEADEFIMLCSLVPEAVARFLQRGYHKPKAILDLALDMLDEGEIDKKALRERSVREGYETFADEIDEGDEGEKDGPIPLDGSTIPLPPPINAVDDDHLDRLEDDGGAQMNGRYPDWDSEEAWLDYYGMY